jgi:hypothetical protein
MGSGGSDAALSEDSLEPEPGRGGWGAVLPEDSVLAPDPAAYRRERGWVPFGSLGPSQIKLTSDFPVMGFFSFSSFSVLSST